jgi:DNA-binding beta-propeller fold protein YncE
MAATLLLLFRASAAPAAPAHDGMAAAPARVWPAPPAKPRVAFVQTIAGPSDFAGRPSGWNRLANLVTGGDRGREKWVKPFGIALDESDNLCVTDLGTGRVWFLDRLKKQVRSWEKTGPFAFSSPVAVAKWKDRLYVADSVLQKVVVFNLQGKFLLAIDQHLDRPTGLAIAAEKLFVADAAAHRVAVFSLDGKWIRQFGQRGAGLGELNFPTHLAVNVQGNLLVTDSLNARIQVLDPEGRPSGMIGSAGDGSGHFSRPKGVAADRFGHVYVVDALFDNFQIFDSQGRFLLAIGAPGTAAGEFWMPAGVAISRDQEIFVADSYNGRVQVFEYIAKER